MWGRIRCAIGRHDGKLEQKDGEVFIRCQRCRRRTIEPPPSPPAERRVSTGILSSEWIRSQQERDADSEKCV